MTQYTRRGFLGILGVAAVAPKAVKTIKATPVPEDTVFEMPGHLIKNIPREAAQRIIDNEDGAPLTYIEWSHQAKPGNSLNDPNWR
jgi:hypothetical protein